ncbi:MAG TPA: YtxH domain-containing protein [Candidatus Eisenbacteria bacterium]|jgi:gas vesicle protein
MQEYPDLNDSGRNATNITPFVFGAVLGAGIALLLAPAHGRDTRKRVGTTVKHWGEGARQALKRTRENLNDFKHDAKSAIEKGRQEYLRTRSPEAESGIRT